jgi:hypothetical protein
MSVQIIIRGKDQNTFENLDKSEYLLLTAKVLEIVHGSFQKSHGSSSSVILLKPRPVSDFDIKYRTEVCTDLFKIMYADMKMGFTRCLDLLPDIFDRKLSNPNWDITQDDTEGMWVDPDAK